MFVLCGLRAAMPEGPRSHKLSVVLLSFTRTLTETRLFLRKLLSAAEPCQWTPVWIMYIECYAKHRVKYKPNRQFSRDRQE